MGDTMLLRGERVLLRQGRAEDIERLSQIRSEPEVARWWGDFEADDLRQEFVDRDAGFVVEVDCEIVGAIQYAEATASGVTGF